jgi:hypothetical protein
MVVPDVRVLYRRSSSLSQRIIATPSLSVLMDQFSLMSLPIVVNVTELRTTLVLCVNIRNSWKYKFLTERPIICKMSKSEYSTHLPAHILVPLMITVCAATSERNHKWHDESWMQQGRTQIDTNCQGLSRNRTVTSGPGRERCTKYSLMWPQ